MVPEMWYNIFPNNNKTITYESTTMEKISQENDVLKTAKVLGLHN